MTIDGPLKSVYVVNDDDLKVNGGRWLLMGGGAIKVRGYTSDTIASRRVIGGDALPVYVLGENDIKQRGGNFRLKGGQPIRVTDVIGAVRGVKQGAAVAVYPVLDDGVTYDDDFPAGAFDPTDLADLQLWLLADTATFQDNAFTVPATADTDPIGGWQDQSGLANHATQDIAGDRPLLRLNIINGLPVIRLDGTNDILDLTVGIVPATIFFVIRFLNTAAISTNSQIVGSGGSSTRVMFLGNTTRFDWATFNTPIALVAQDTPYLITVTVDVPITTTKVGFDAGALAGGDYSVSTYNPAGTNRIGARRDTGPWGNIDLGEVISYSSVLSDADIAQVREYLNTRWAIY